MTQLPLIIDNDDTKDIPLPLIVAQRWNFPLAHLETENGMVYAVQDWMRGLIGGNVRNLVSMLRRNKPQVNTLFKMLPYKSTNNKIYKCPYTDEAGLLFILVHSRLSRGRSRLAEIRNFIADSYSEHEYLKCHTVQEKTLSEPEFQSSLVQALARISYNYEIQEYYQTKSGHVIDAIVSSPTKAYIGSLLIECKVNNKAFYSAVGQIICYEAEISQETLTKNYALAIAMPYEAIDDYMREITSRLLIRLISIKNEVLIDAVTGEAFESIEQIIATGKRLLANG